MKKILIIGGGVIGLSIAYEISKNNRFKVLLVESKPLLYAGYLMKIVNSFLDLI